MNLSLQYAGKEKWERNNNIKSLELTEFLLYTGYDVYFRPLIKSSETVKLIDRVQRTIKKN